MSQAIVRLYALVVVLFALLIAFTSRWAVFEADALRDNPANRRALLQEERVKRGIIRSADGKAIAGSERIEGERYRRRYPLGPLFGHPVGYSFTRIGRNGLERSRNDDLAGRRTELVSVLDSILGRRPIGREVRTTLNARAQQVARDGLGGRKGSVVALDAHTGAVLVMYSNPPFDPNGLDDPKTFARLNRDQDAPLLNRAVQGLYPPGSTFKVVTAAAALDSGEFEPDSQVDGKNGVKISGVPLNNFGGESYGKIDLTTALTKSVNTVWAQVGEELGRDTMAEYMQRFGFYSAPEVDLPDDQLRASGERSPRTGRLLSPTSARIDVGRMAIGQHQLLVTPLQMAMVAATVANGGVRMKPHITAKVVDSDGRTTEDVEPDETERVMSEETAATLAQMMKNVVREGTGTAAALEGIEVAGKTGTAELNNAGLNQPWFIGFAGNVAVAVTLERVQGGQGGTVAAPVAKRVLEALGE